MQKTINESIKSLDKIMEELATVILSVDKGGKEISDAYKKLEGAKKTLLKIQVIEE